MDSLIQFIHNGLFQIVQAVAVGLTAVITCIQVVSDIISKTKIK